VPGILVGVKRIVPDRRWLATVGGWLASAAAATAIGTLAVGAIGSGIAGTGTEPLSLDQVEQQLATASSPAPPTSTPTGTAESTPSPTGDPTGHGRVFGTKGGSVVARCIDGKAELISWSPAQGYQTDDVRRGPGSSAGIQFETDDLEINVKITCVNGVPTSHVTTNRD
jgi:hypothetical protein